jgi:hypothetical protein
MSSTLIRRIAAIFVAVAIPFGATASSAHAADWSPAPHAHVVVVGDDNDSGPGFTPHALFRSSWS